MDDKTSIQSKQEYKSKALSYTKLYTAMCTLVQTIQRYTEWAYDIHACTVTTTTYTFINIFKLAYSVPLLGKSLQKRRYDELDSFLKDWPEKARRKNN